MVQLTTNQHWFRSWWRHQMEPFSALLAICAGNSPVSGEFPAQRPLTRGFGVSFDQRPNKWLCQQSWGWRFETHSHPLWHHSNVLAWCRTDNKPLLEPVMGKFCDTHHVTRPNSVIVCTVITGSSLNTDVYCSCDIEIYYTENYTILIFVAKRHYHLPLSTHVNTFSHKTKIGKIFFLLSAFLFCRTDLSAKDVIHFLMCLFLHFRVTGQGMKEDSKRPGSGVKTSGKEQKTLR